MKGNKWLIEIRDEAKIANQDDGITWTHYIAIPPTTGDRTDIIGQSGKYYYGMTKKEFKKRMSKEEYLETMLPNLSGEEKKKAINQISYTPQIIKDEIKIIIDIKQGEVTLKTR